MEKPFAKTSYAFDEKDGYLKMVWEEMISKKNFEKSRMRSLISDSWQRCMDAGVDFEKQKAEIVVNRADLSMESRNEQELIEVTREVLTAHFSKWIIDKDFIMALTNNKGIILLVEGKGNLLYRSQRNNFVIGADWSEYSAGTNAIGTSIAISKPIQVFSWEHYCQGWQDWTCSAAPIRDPLSGQILGILDISGDKKDSHPHTLSFAVAAARIIENKLLERKLIHKKDLYESILSASSDGVIIIDDNENILSMNPIAQEILSSYQQVEPSKVLSKYDNLYKVYYENKAANCSAEVIIGQKLYVITITPIVYRTVLTGHAILLKQHKSSLLAGMSNPSTHNKGPYRTYTFPEIITTSSEMIETLRIARIAANNDAHVLLFGETGTGKELIAQAIHNAGSRKDGPFIPVNCGALSKELIESELFGYSEGAFTGAKKNGQKGKFEQASGGTLFLDEIGEMPLEMQVPLLRVLEDKIVYPVGGGKPRRVDFKVIAATNKNLRKEIEKGTFRQDLYYRLNILSIKIPALRERKGDIPLLIDHFLKRFQRDILDMNQNLLMFLQQYSWPGNIRELKNTLERIVYLSQGTAMNVNLLPPDLLQLFDLSKKGLMNLEKAHEEDEKYLIKKVLYDTGYNHTLAAQKLGISRSTLYRKLKKYALYEDT